MAQVNPSALHNFVTGETVTDVMLDQNFEVIRVGLNDVDSKSPKNIQFLNAAGQAKLQTAVSAIAGLLNLQEGSSIVLTSPVAGQIKIDVVLSANAVGTSVIADGAVTAAKLDPAILLSSGDPTYNLHKGAAIIDHPDQSVTTVKIKDQNVTTAKLADANVTLAKLAQDVQDTISMMQCLQWMEVNP